MGSDRKASGAGAGLMILKRSHVGCNKCTLLGREVVCLWGNGVCGNSVLSAQFCYNLKLL